MNVRNAALDDLDAICALEDTSFSDPWSREAFEGAFESRICRFLVAEDGGAVIGYALFSVLYEDAEIMSIAVDPAKRRLGAGSAMLQEIIECAKAAQAQMLFLEVRDSNEAAREMYLRAGFEELRRIKRYYRRPVEDAIVMRLSLA